MNKTKPIKIGNKVKWTGRGRGGSADHVGKVIELCENGRGAKLAQVAVTKPGGGVKIYTPYVVWLQRA